MFSQKESKYVFTAEYVKIKSTILPSNFLDNIESSIYRVTFNGIDNILKFGIALEYHEMLYLDENHLIGDKIKLHEWEGALYLCFYVGNNLNHVIPIKEVGENHLSLYGVLGHDDEVVAKKLLE